MLQDRAGDARAGTFRLRDDRQVLFPKEAIVLARHTEGEAAIRDRLLPAATAFLQAHAAQWGWFYPTTNETLTSVLRDLRQVPDLHSTEDEVSGMGRIGTTFLKSCFPSFWQVRGGPVDAFADPIALRRVVAYRLGLNNSAQRSYRLPDGTSIAGTETMNFTLADIRTGFIVQRHGVSFFKPEAAYQIYRRWLSVPTPTVWDPSCGFGARLLAFAAAFPGGRYYGNEPATKIRADVQTLADALRPEVHSFIDDTGSEHTTLPQDSLDLVFTSPPYFDREKYYDEPGQCWRDYPTQRAWIARYVKPTLATALHALKPGAYAVFNVDAERSSVLRDAAKDVGFHFAAEHRLMLRADHFSRKKGSDNDRSEPILVFQKEE